MTPDEHYREAEKMLADVRTAAVEINGRYFEDLEELKNIERAIQRGIAEAQVHATLATIYRSTERLVEKPALRRCPECDEVYGSHKVVCSRVNDPAATLTEAEKDYWAKEMRR